MGVQMRMLSTSPALGPGLPSPGGLCQEIHVQGDCEWSHEAIQEYAESAEDMFKCVLVPWLVVEGVAWYTRHRRIWASIQLAASL